MPHCPFPTARFTVLALLLLASLAPLRAQGTVLAQLVDYAAVPLSGQLVGSTDNSIYVARVNFLRQEPGPATGRFFVNDLNGKLHVLDQTTRQFATYLDFHRNTAENPAASGLFPAFTRANGYANGLVTFQFDPAYADAASPHFGKFYTVHIELDTNDADPRRIPNASSFSGYTNAAAYAPTTAFEAPGNDNANTRHAVLIEWQDTSPADAIFQGTARELLRIEFNGRIHPLGDIIFNPLATSPAHPDHRKMYLAVGDGGAGEQNNPVLHPTPQRLDVLQGKILRLSPDDPDGPGPLRYGIPADNPFTGPATTVPAGTRPEIWASGFRNPHRLFWDATADLLLAADIGFHTWEEVNIVRRGANYGYGEREGTFALDLRSGRADLPLPADDARHGYTYPIIQYPHSPALGWGDAIAGAFVYRGTRIPQLQGKLVFGDITTGQLFYADLAAARAADDGNPDTLAPFQRLELMWDNPRNPAGPERHDRMYEIVLDEYRARGGRDTDLPGSATVSDLTGGGRADIRFALDHAGEIYVLSKSDGMIRTLAAYESPFSAAPTITRQPESQQIAAGGTVVFSVEASADTLGYQWKRNGVNLPGAHGVLLTLANVSSADAGAYTVEVSRGPATRISDPATLTVLPAAATSGRIANFSIRSAAGTGDQTLIVGFALAGAATSADPAILVRGIGPALAGFGVDGWLADPRLELFRGRTRIAENDNWDPASPVATTAAAVRAFPLPAGSRDAALFQPGLAPGAYTAQIAAGASPPAASTGIALAEIFDATPAGVSARELVNVSARTQVAAGDGTLIAGFILGGDTARTVLIRAAGPALNAFRVNGTLPNPTLALYRGATRLADNDDWRSSPELVAAFTAAGAFPFNARSRDAVLYLTLPPGAYTAHVTGLGPANATTGLVLIEIYTLR